MVKKKSLFKNKKLMKNYKYQIISSILLIGIVAVLLINSLLSGSTQSVVLTVNGDKITQEDLQNRLAFMQTMGVQATQEQALDEIVTETLLLQEANRRNLRVSNEEVSQEFNDILIANGLTEEDLRAQLELGGVSFNYFESYFENNLVISLLIDQVIAQIDVLDEDINLYYAQNLDQFQQPERAVVRHILISNENEDYQQKAQEVRDLINQDASNFCELVTEYNDDIASTDQCGEYVFGQNDPFVEEFKDAGLEMEIGEIRNVETMFGIHIMIKDDVLPAEEISLNDAREDIRAFLSQSLAQQEFESLLDELRIVARIS
ncbi:MAG: peptidylprolyl isomerase [Candidatus Woesearchaeota archaeon]